jgi:hypothetical protein
MGDYRIKRSVKVYCSDVKTRDAIANKAKSLHLFYLIDEEHPRIFEIDFDTEDAARHFLAVALDEDGVCTRISSQHLREPKVGNPAKKRELVA